MTQTTRYHRENERVRKTWDLKFSREQAWAVIFTWERKNQRINLIPSDSNCRDLTECVTANGKRDTLDGKCGE